MSKMRFRLAAAACLGAALACAPAEIDDEEVAVEEELAVSEGESNLPSAEPPAAAVDCAITVASGKELLIRGLATVDDPVRTRWTGSLSNPSDGAWHFGRLMTNMAGANDPSTFVLRWLNRWKADRTINGQRVAARPSVQRIIDAWPKKADGELDLTRPPMRLLAIVNRIDLRNLAAGSAGEGRFVFGVLDGAGNPLSFTVILEYKLLATTQAELESWADDWHALNALTGEAYRAQLERVTNRFAGRGVAPTRPNGSAISQVRTNEIALSSPWELREFKLSATSGDLAEVTTARTPADALNGTTVLRDFINQNEAAILAGTHGVPASFAGAPFRAAATENNVDFWNAAGIRSAQARHLFSLNTCDGCHGAETRTAFLQVSPRAAGQVAALSGFLIGTTVTDPVSGQSRTFNDLARRNRDFKQLLCSFP